MKTLPVVLTPEAEADLDGIGLFIVGNGAHPLTAVGYLNRIRDRCRKIGLSPHGGVARDDIHPGLRMVPFEKSAVVLYRVTKDAVAIVSIIYGGRDYEALMRDPS